MANCPLRGVIFYAKVFVEWSTTERGVRSGGIMNVWEPRGKQSGHRNLL